MARALRIERPGGRYHVTARGNERKAICRSDSDRAHFLQLLAEVTGQFGIRVHAYVLMDNHYHLLLETPEANLSRAMHWINVGYSIWFNLLHERVGHLFQGRFSGKVIEDDGGWQEVARYMHLNPVRIGRLALNKAERAASQEGLVAGPAAELVAERLRCLREFRWSSYRAYAGYTRPVEWLWRQPLERLCGGRTEAERQAALRDYTEQPLRQGVLERPWDRLVAGMVLGSEAFAKELRQALRGHVREQPAARALSGRRLVSFKPMGAVRMGPCLRHWIYSTSPAWRIFAGTCLRLEPMRPWQWIWCWQPFRSSIGSRAGPRRRG